MQFKQNNSSILNTHYCKSLWVETCSKLTPPHMIMQCSITSGVVLDCATGHSFFISGTLGCSGALAAPCPCATYPPLPAGPARAACTCLTFCVTLVTGSACPLGTDGRLLLLLAAMGSSRRLLLRWGGICCSEGGGVWRRGGGSQINVLPFIEVQQRLTWMKYMFIYNKYLFCHLTLLQQIHIWMTNHFGSDMVVSLLVALWSGLHLSVATLNRLAEVGLGEVHHGMLVPWVVLVVLLVLGWRLGVRQTLGGHVLSVLLVLLLLVQGLMG